MASTDALIACARALLGVRFAHQGRSVQGLDCLGLVLVAAEQAGYRVDGLKPSALDQQTYGARPDTQYLQARLEQHLQRVETFQRGDLLLLNIEGRPQHLSLVSDYPVEGQWGMIHAYAVARKVVEHRLDEQWQSAIAAIYRLKIRN